MEFSIPGFIKEFCTPNALLTLEEYLVDYAAPETRVVGEKLIEEELARIEDGSMKSDLAKRLKEIRDNQNRDLYF
jgi:2-iminoacetate synthase